VELAFGIGFPPLLEAKQNYYQFFKDGKLQKVIAGVQEAHQN
jgi:hypothetical protein